MPTFINKNQKYKFNYKMHRYFLPSGPADLTASTSLQPIRGIQIQLRGLLHRRYRNLDWSIIQEPELFIKNACALLPFQK